MSGIESIIKNSQSKSFQKLNEHLLNPVAARPCKGPKSERRSEGEDQCVEIPAQDIRFCITLIQCRRKLLDCHDSLPYSLKPTVDAIAEWLGLKSDSDPRLRWQYGQQQTRGEEGTIVRIEVI